MLGIAGSTNRVDARRLKGGVNPEIPEGIIAMWIGDADDIPSGWVVCDGDNGTPDLNNRYINLDSSTGFTDGPTSIDSDGHSHDGFSTTDSNTFASDTDSASGSSTDTVTLTLDNRPRTIEYVLIQSVGSGEFVPKVTGMAEEPRKSLTDRIVVNDGTSVTPNATNRSIRGSVSSTGSTFGSDSGTDSGRHRHNLDETEFVDDDEFTYTSSNTSRDDAEFEFETNPDAIHFYFVSMLLRYGLPSESDFEGTLFFYEGDVDDLPDGWEERGTSDTFVRQAESDSQLGSIDGNIEYGNTESHTHTTSSTFGETEEGGSSVAPHTDADSECDPESDTFSASEEKPPHYSLRLVEVVSV